MLHERADQGNSEREADLSHRHADRRRRRTIRRNGRDGGIEETMQPVRPTAIDASLVNRLLRAKGEPAVNGKRVLRIMRMNGLTLAPYTSVRPGRTHEIVVIALRSNVSIVSSDTSGPPAPRIRSNGCPTMARPTSSATPPRT